MAEFSVTNTAGTGSERHNHSIEYRDSLKHTHDSNDQSVVELVPYIPYKEHINKVFKPYIDEYNKRVDERYQEAWDRYNNGVIKTKPRKRDYKHVDYDYYEQHKDDTVREAKTGKMSTKPMFRSQIIGIGKECDRSKITEKEAVDIFKQFTERFQEKFPSFEVLGATVHLDEHGFYHMHLDYLPVYESKSDKGIGLNNSLDGCLEAMGYKPEKSIINGKDKRPLLFNALRNKIYALVEESLNDHNHTMQYFVSRADPTKDSSTNQSLEDWQEIQDTVKDLQHEKNVLLQQVFDADDNIDGLEKTLLKTTELQDQVATNMTSSFLDKNHMKVPTSMMNRLLSSLNNLKKRILSLLKRIMRLDKENRLLRRENNDLKDEIKEAKSNEQQAINNLDQARLDAWGNSIIRENDELKATNNELVGVLDHVINKQESLVKENDHMKYYLSKHDKLSDKEIGRIAKSGDVKDRNRSL